MVSLSNHERPFDRLRANGEKPYFRNNDTRRLRLTDKGETDTREGV